MNHTPGPWRIEDGNIIAEHEDRSIFLGKIYSFGLPYDRLPEVDANGRLIESAPDLYAAALAILDAWNDADRFVLASMTVPIEVLRNVVTRAQGESNHG